MRYLVKKIPSTSLVQYDGSRYYCEIAGGTAEKSTVDTTGLLAGSKYLDVQTGTWYVYDELTNAWAVSAEGGSADPAVVEAAVEAWLDAHPEATTTVQDGSISYAKLDTTLKSKADAVTTLSDEIVNTNNNITIVSGVQTMKFEDGYIDIPKVGSEASVSRVSYAQRKSAVAQIDEGQLVNINVIGVGTSSAGGRAWAFLDDNHIVLSRAASQLTVHGTLVAPANSAYIVLNTRTDTITDYYGYIGMINQSQVLTTADTNAKNAVKQLTNIIEKAEIDLSTLEVKQFWIDTANNIIDESIAVPERLVVVPVEENESVYVDIPLVSTKRIAFCNSVADGSPAYSAQEISGSLVGTFKNSNYKYFVIQLFINSDADKDYTHYLQNAEIATITAIDSVARDEIKNLKENGSSGIFVEENLKGLPILDSFNDITIVTSAYNNCSAFHALVKSELCDNSDGYLVQTLLGNDGHGNSLYKYVTNPYELRYNASREFGTPSYPIAGGSVAPIYTVIVTTNIHGIEHGSNWVMFNLLKKLQNPDTDMLRFFKNNVRFVWIPYICASGNYENADGININRDFPTTASGTCSSAEGTLVKSVLDEYGPVANLHIDIHTFDTTGTYARHFATWTFTDSSKLGKRSVKVSKSVVDRYSAKYPNIDVLTRNVVSAINTPTTCTYYTQSVYGVPAGTIEGALQMDGSPSGADAHTSATAYLYDIITQVICAMAC